MFPCKALHLFLLPALATLAQAAAPDYPIQPVPFTAVQLKEGFWKSRQDVNRTVTLPFAFQQCEESNRLRNFDLAAETMKRRAAGETGFQNKPLTIYPFDDTDIYKTLEGAAYAYSQSHDPELDRRMDAAIARIAAAQEPDGYLYTFRTMHPDSPAHEWIQPKRWLGDPVLSHELYNLGHLYEAGAAHFQATGKRSLLDICVKNAELLQRDFGKGDLKIAPGHPILELGLCKLYRATGDQRWLNLARFFLEVRGPGGDTYNQQHLKVVDQTEAVGHAVRAGYLYSGMADVAALTGDQRYVKAIDRLWTNVVDRKLYLTGGIGARYNAEAFGDDYELPHHAYNETCAAISNLMWNHRMFLMEGDAKFMDVFERTLYNGFLSGISLSGDRFFYPNVLTYDGSEKNNHGFAGRAPWFGCACCPPNVMRTLAALTGYSYAVRDARLYVNLFAASEGTVTVQNQAIHVSQATQYPWKGRIRLGVDPAKPTRFTLAIRIPGWAQGHPVPSGLYTYTEATPTSWTLTLNGKPVKARMEKGYALVDRAWHKGDAIELELPMAVHRVVGNPAIAATRGQVALERGPVVYALEGCDLKEGSILETSLPESATIRADARPELLGGVTVLKIQGARLKGQNQDLVAIPYYAWNNRGLAPMRVWFPTGEPVR